MAIFKFTVLKINSYDIIDSVAQVMTCYTFK